MKKFFMDSQLLNESEYNNEVKPRNTFSKFLDKIFEDSSLVFLLFKISCIVF